MACGLVYNQTKPNQTNAVRIWSLKYQSGLVLVSGRQNQTKPVITKPNQLPIKRVIIFDKRTVVH
jgi:hypothetical protein